MAKSPATADDKKAKQFQAFTSKLTSRAARLMTEDEPVLPGGGDDAAYSQRQLEQALTDKALGMLDAPLPGESPEIDEAFEVPDGGWPVMRVYKTADGLAQRLGVLEGEDVAVCLVYGVPLQFTKGPPRYLLLPDHEHAISIPEGKRRGRTQVVDVDLLSKLEMQDDFYIGPPELAEAFKMPEKLQAKPAVAKPQAISYDTDDEEDDDDDGDEETGKGSATK